TDRFWLEDLRGLAGWLQRTLRIASRCRLQRDAQPLSGIGSQLVFLDLAGARSQRKFIDEVDVPGQLVAGKAALQVRQQRVFGEFMPRAKLDVGDADVVFARPGDADYGTCLHFRAGIDGVLDLARSDVEAPRLVSLSMPPDEDQPAVFAEEAEVAGSQPAFWGHGLRGLRRFLVIFEHVAIAARPYVSGFTRSNRLPVPRSPYAHFHIG